MNSLVWHFKKKKRKEKKKALDSCVDLDHKECSFKD